MQTPAAKRVLAGTSHASCMLFNVGLIEEPIKGANEAGVEGLLKGAGKGLLGFVVKPLTGVLDFAQKTAEGIKVSSEANNVLFACDNRLRLPAVCLLPYFRGRLTGEGGAASADSSPASRSRSGKQPRIGVTLQAQASCVVRQLRQGRGGPWGEAQTVHVHPSSPVCGKQRSSLDAH